ncbi:hypothetical protein GA0074695_0076 [Micromonospora viridifaciens]|uniref:Uncharacterized protein n=1 Tax=Micromonospora viridifaciens TaxID=1881 RepID=A0A1C4U1T1_MICVI|nr:hypothetical protein [Micromonospora viridifaciens]SCE65642.1 hypothetical protein GA0074695_0076 [Micromonospora viridifaciens]
MDETRYRDRIDQLVEPGEQVLAYAKASAANGAPPAPPLDAAQPEAPAGRVSIGAVLFNLISPLVSWGWGDRLVDRMLWGIAGRSAPGSAASRLHHALHPSAPDLAVRDTLLAVTDQRLLVCVSGPMKLLSSRDDEERALAETRVAWSASRAEVASARVGWHRLNPKRLRIDFTDGSWLAFTVPIAESGRPLRAVAAALSA